MSFSNACWWTELAFLQDNHCFQLLLLYFFATNKLTRPPCDSFVLIKPGTKGKNFSHSFQFNCCYFLAPLEKKFCSNKRVFEQFERSLLASKQVYLQPAYCDSLQSLIKLKTNKKRLRKVNWKQTKSGRKKTAGDWAWGRRLTDRDEMEIVKLEHLLITSNLFLEQLLIISNC